MDTVMIEAVQDIHHPAHNHGKFLVGRMDSREWNHLSQVAPGSPPLLAQCGWGGNFLWVMDLQTGEGIYTRPGGSAHADLAKHNVWVCPLFEPFLEWLYKQDTTDINSLRSVIELPEAEFAMSGHRREGLHLVRSQDLTEDEKKAASPALLAELDAAVSRLREDGVKVVGQGLAWEHDGQPEGWLWYESTYTAVGMRVKVNPRG